MRRPAAILILLLLTSCRFYDNGKRAAASAVLHTVLHMQAYAPLTQNAARPPAVAPGRARRLIAPRHQVPCSGSGATFANSRLQKAIAVTPDV
jgi:hypothetical protein